MKKHFYVLMGLLFFSSLSFLYAESGYVCLCLKTGEKISCALNEKPRISYGNSLVKIASENLSMEYRVLEVDRVVFTAESLGIDGVTIPEGEMFNQEGNLLFQGFEPGMLIQILSVSGQILFAGNTDSQGALFIELSSFPQGVFLVCANGKNYKIAKK